MDLVKSKAESLSKRLNKVATSLAKQCDDAEIMELKAQVKAFLLNASVSFLVILH